MANMSKAEFKGLPLSHGLEVQTFWLVVLSLLFVAVA